MGVPTKVVETAIAGRPGLGDDQTGAVRALCGPGPALRVLTAPAGHGKTTTLATAVAAVEATGWVVLAVSTTNQAVVQLRQAGLAAMTVARFALERPHLADGTVIICDEFSQLPTREADTPLAAVAACPDGQVWMVGDPLQAQPVAAGGLAHYLTAAHPSEPSGQPRIVSAGLSVNRRQADPAEQAALGCLRAGDVPASQTLRDAHGWEHHAEDPARALQAMAAAVTADIARHGARAGGGAGRHPRRLRAARRPDPSPTHRRRPNRRARPGRSGLCRAPPLPGRGPDPAARPPAPPLRVRRRPPLQRHHRHRRRGRAVRAAHRTRPSPQARQARPDRGGTGRLRARPHP